MLRIIFILLVLIGASATTCRHFKTSSKICRARLEIKGLCYNYTIKLLDGNIDTSLINTTWTNESTGKSYTNVFSLEDPCSFLSTIKQGDEFYFVIDTAKAGPCIVCMAYYPHPPKRLHIKVVDGRQ